MDKDIIVINIYTGFIFNPKGKGDVFGFGRKHQHWLLRKVNSEKVGGSDSSPTFKNLLQYLLKIESEASLAVSVKL